MVSTSARAEIVVPDMTLHELAVAAYVAGRVGADKRLADVIVAEQIPKSPTGKVLTRECLARERTIALDSNDREGVSSLTASRLGS